MRATLPAIFLGMFLAAHAHADLAGTKITVDAGKHDRKNVPVRVLLRLPEQTKPPATVSLTDADVKSVAGQITTPSLLAPSRVPGDAKKEYELTFVVGELAAGKKRTYTVGIVGDSAERQFVWHDTPGKQAELKFGDRPVLRYMCLTYDGSSKEGHELTKKIFHHAFSPDGSQIVTNGPGGLYSHHRGLFYGFSKCRYGKNQHADTWHCGQGERQTHEEFLAGEAGPVLGRHRLAVDWHGKDGKVFAKEIREMTAYNTAGGTLIEFQSRLKSTGGKVVLDGDPQHAGFQFRASQEVAAKTNKQTYYLRTDGKGKPGETRNWPSDKRQANLPWNAMSFVVGGKRYTAVYLDHPQNPKEARYSERDYGRFGSYFVKEIEGDQTCDVKYRIWLTDGEMTVDEATAQSNNFVDPPQVTVAK